MVYTGSVCIFKSDLNEIMGQELKVRFLMTPSCKRISR